MIDRRRSEPRSTNPSTESGPQTTEGERRRQERVREVVLSFLELQALEHQTDDHQVLHIKLPVGPSASYMQDWVVTFDKHVARDRLAELMNFTNPRFQKLLRSVTDKPVLSYRIVQRPGQESVDSSWGQSVLRTDFAFHITYGTYGETREELFVTSAGAEDLGNALVSDAFHPQAFALPAAVRQHHEAALENLRRHIGKRSAEFTAIAADRLEAERERLDRYGRQRAPGGHGYKAIAEDNEFFQKVIEQNKRTLDLRYGVTIHARLLTVEPYFAAGVDS
jgi:hypothetical protein